MRCNNCNSTIPEVSTTCPYCKKVVDPNAKPIVDFGDINNTDYDEKFDIKVYIKEPKNKKTVLMAAGVVLLVLIIFIALIMSMFIGKKEPSYKMFNEVVDTFVEYLEENYLGSNSTSTGEYKLSVTVNGKENSFNGTYAYDIKNKILSLSGVMKDPREASGGIILETLDFDFNTYLKEDEFYFQSNQLYGESYIYFPIEDESGFLATKNYSLDSIVSGLQDALNYTLEDMTYETEATKINYRGKETNVKKKYIVLDNKNKIKFITSFYDNLIDDTNFINELARIKEKKTDEIIKTLENYKTTAEYKYSGESSNKTLLSIYYSGSNIYRLEIDASEDETKDLYRLDIGDTKYYFDYYKDNKNVYSATLSVTTKEIQNIVAKTYDITFDSDEYVIDIELYLEIDESGKVKKQDVTNNKNIKEFTEDDYSKIKVNAQSYVSDITFIDKIREKFKEKCSPSLNCICGDEDTCNCTYEGKIITCPRNLVTTENSIVNQ